MAFAALMHDFRLLTENEANLANFGFEESNQKSSLLIQMEILESLSKDEQGLLMTLHPLAFAAKANNEDMPTYSQVMNGLDALGYIEAMKKKMDQLEEKDPWEMIPLSEIPEGANILDSTWAFKRKQFPDGSIRKLKARFCVRGDQQMEGVDFFDTYASVMAWSTV
jgi:hypothetical protein